MLIGVKRLTKTRWEWRKTRKAFTSDKAEDLEKVQTLLTPSQFVLCKNMAPILSDICSVSSETKILEFLSYFLMLVNGSIFKGEKQCENQKNNC